MNKKPLKPCKHYGCPNLTRETYCEQHKYKAKQDNAERQKYYDENVRWKRDRKYAEFYKSKEWERVRRAVLARDNGLCQECLKNKRITLADAVHHIVEVKEDWSKRFQLDNLISVCTSCHNKIHSSNHTP